MANWKKEFVSKIIKNYIVLTLSNYFKYQSYIYHFNKNNLKNNMYAVISDFWHFKYKNG